MFVDRTSLLEYNPAQLNYGIAVTDVDHDGELEAFVAGFGCPNLILKWDSGGFIDVSNPLLADEERQAIGVAAGDIDCDGEEEIYVLNTDTFGGQKQFGDRLWDFGGDEWVDLFSLRMHQQVINLTAGRSVAAVDRLSSGRYGFFIANYGGPMRLYELNDDGRLEDVAPQAGLARITGGRGVVALPLISDCMDIVAVNENGANFLFFNRGDGTFEEVAAQAGLSDRYEHGRGIAALDANGDGRFDLVYGNWEGPHRLFVQTGAHVFHNVAPPLMALPSRVRTVIAADFDNDGYEEIFFNNIGEANRLFGFRDGAWKPLDIGAAGEPFGLGTGAAVGDFDHDGRLELLIAHGESGSQPLSLYHVPQNGNAWLRVMPLTQYGAPARGAVVRLVTGDRTQIRAIDAGSGYLCQMEPVAHFGLGASPSPVKSVEVRWLDGTTKTIEAPEPNQFLRVAYPK
jgi:hypothetical protein